MNQDTQAVVAVQCPTAHLSPAPGQHHGGTAGPNHCSSGAAAGLLSAVSTFSLSQSQTCSLACPAQSVVSVSLQVKELNLALTLPLVSVALGLSLFVQGAVVLLHIELARAFFPIFPAGSGNIYFINIYKKLKISLLFCHKPILLCL